MKKVTNYGDLFPFSKFFCIMKNKQYFYLIFALFIVNTFLILYHAFISETNGLSISILNAVLYSIVPFIGFIFLMENQENKHSQKIKTLLADLDKSKRRQEKNKHCLVQYDGVKGLARLTKQLRKVEKIRTVWMSKPGYNKKYSTLLLQWEEAILRNLSQKKTVEDILPLITQIQLS